MKVNFPATLAPWRRVRGLGAPVDLASGVMQDAAHQRHYPPDITERKGEQTAKPSTTRSSPAIADFDGVPAASGVQDACASDFIRDRLHHAGAGAAAL